MKIVWAKIKMKNTTQPSVLISAKNVIMRRNHLFFYSHYKEEAKYLVLKVWLKKRYGSIEKALKDVGIEVEEY